MESTAKKINETIKIENLQLNLGMSGSVPLTLSVNQFVVPLQTNLALTGPSGCGKSSLLNVIAGLLLYKTGKVIVLEQELKQLSSSQLDEFRGRHIGYIYQNFNLINHFTALENIMIGMRFGRVYKPNDWKERAELLLNRVGLASRSRSKVETLSNGEKQRVAIARALANQPEIILADEPTGSLDPKTAQNVLQLLLDIAQEEQATLLCVTHDQEISQNFPNQFDCHNLIQTQEVTA